MQSTIREHKDRTGGHFMSYTIHKVSIPRKKKSTDYLKTGITAKTFIFTAIKYVFQGNASVCDTFSLSLFCPISCLEECIFTVINILLNNRNE